MQHLYDLINDHKPNNKKSKVWKIQISTRVKCISSKDTGEIRTIYVWSNNERIAQGSDAHDIIRELSKSYVNNYQKEEKIISGSEINFESVDLMDYEYHKVSLKRGRSYIKSHEWLINKRATINPKDEEDDKCFQYSIISALNYSKIKKKELENIFKNIKHEDTDSSSHQRNWENLNKTMSQSLLMSHLQLVYKSEHNYKQENNVILLINNDNEKHYYFAVKSKLELYSPEWLRIKKEATVNRYK